MSHLAKNTAYLTVASIGQKIVAFVYFAMIARVVGVEWTGKYFLALSITTMVGVIADFGLTPVLVRETAKHPDQEQKILANALGAKLGLTALAFALAVLITNAFGHDELTRQLVYVATIVMALDTLHLTYYGVFRGRHRLSVESVGIFVGQIVTLTVGVTSLLIHPSLYFLIGALMAGSLWNVLFSAYRLKRSGGNPLSIRFDWFFIKRILKTALPFALAAIFVKIYSTTDSLLLKHFMGDEAVGLYSIAYKLTYAFQFLPLAFVAALYPTFSKLIHEKSRKELMATFEKAYWYMALLSVPIVFGIWAVADQIVVLIYGASYAGSVAPLQTLIFVLLFIFLDFPIGALLNADDRQSTKTAIMGGTMVINVLANIILIPQFGIMGACYSALLAFLFLYLAGMYFVRSSIDYDIKRLVRLGAPILCAGILMAIIVLILKVYITILVVIPVGAAVYVAVLMATNTVNVKQFKEFKKGMRS